MTILGIVDQNGKLVVKYKYDAYGNSKGIEDTSGIGIGSYNPFRYKGYYYDDDTEMYYCKSRFYVPKWRRWLNSDSINYLEPQNIICLNLFAYCNNNPVMYVDPTGDFAISILALIIGACIGFGMAAYIDSKDGQMFNGDVKWYDYLGATALGGVVGALATIAFTASIPTFGLISSGGALSLGITGAAELTISGVQIIGTAGIAGLIVMMTKIIGKSGGYTVKHNYPIDHYPTHFHIYGDDIHQGSHGIRVGLDGNPLKWEPNLPYGVRKAIKKLWKEIINALEQWMR